MKTTEGKNIKPKVYDFFDGIIPKGCVTLLAGQGESGKTTLACYMAEMISRNAKVLFVESEEAESFLAARLDPQTTVYIAQLDEGKTQFTSEEIIDALNEFDVIFVDSLRSLAGGKDINRASVAEKFLLPFINATKDTEKSIVFLAHTNKGNQDSVQDMISGSERLVSGVRHCKIVINDKLSGRRFLTIAKDNTNASRIDYEIIANERTIDGQTGSVWVVNKLHPVNIDIEEIIIRNSRKFKEDLVRKKLIEENKKQQYIPKAIKEVLLASNGEDVDTQFVIKNSNIPSWMSAIKKTGEKWITKSKDGRKVTYHWTDEALDWLENHS